MVLGTTNAIDLPRLSTPTLEDAQEFIDNYGFDLMVESQANELDELRSDAVHFMEKQLLQDPDDPGMKLEIPKEVANEKDVRRLMVLASIDPTLAGRWACSLLRVMHTLTHKIGRASCRERV